MNETYEILVDDCVVATFAGDFAQASCPVMLDGDSTPYQVADFRHRPDANCAERLLLWAHGNGCPVCEVWTDEDGERHVDGDEIAVRAITAD